MARYFFHLCDGGDLLIDPDGREVDDVAAIPAMAMKEARWCVSQDALEGYIRFSQSIEVRDEAGELVHRVDFRDAVTLKN